MKKIISILLVAVLVVGFVPAFASAESIPCDHSIKSTQFLRDDSKNIICIEGGAGQNCHFSYCTNCKHWIKVQCEDEEISSKTCGTVSFCDVCGKSFTYHKNVEWRNQSTEVNCYWHCTECKKDGTPHSHYFGEKKTYTIGGKQVSCGVECGSTCLMCGFVRSDAPHRFAYVKTDSKQHWQVCTECGLETEHEDHSGGTATCTTCAVCQYCGASYGTTAEHEPKGEYQHDETNHWLVCKNCNKVYDSNAHSFGEWRKSKTAGNKSRECIECGYVDEKPYSEHRVSFDICGHGSKVENQTVIDGNCAKSPGKLSAVGYSFIGWYKDAAKTIEFRFTEPITQDTVVYAKWDYATYKINYKEKDGTEFKGSHEVGYPETHTYGTATTLKSASEDGYDFYGWFSTADYEGSALTVLDATKYTNDISLYAKLEGHNYKVHYMPNCTDYSGNMTDSEHTYGTYSALNKNQYIRTGYAFEKWTKTTDGSGIYYYDQEKVSDLSTEDGGEVTLHANWKAAEYAIKYYDQDEKEFSGDITGCPTIHTYGTETTLEEPTKPGYEFNGWFTDPGCTTPITVIGKKQITDDIKVYAKWTALKNEIVYYGNSTGVMGKMENQEFTSGDKITLNENKYSKIGYAFLGWSDTEDGSVKYSDKQSDLVFEQYLPVEMYAKWGKISKVTLVTNGGTIAEGKNLTTYVEGVGATLPTKDDVTKDGFDLAGWYDNPDFTGNPITTIATTDTGNKTYYAKWGEKTYTVSFNIVTTSSSTTTTTASGTATVVVDGGTATTVPAAGLIWKDLKGGEVITVTATPGTSYYAKIYTDQKTLATSSKGTAITYQLTADDIKNNSNIKITFTVNPPTGDGFDPILWVIAMASATVGAAITISKKKARK